MPTPAPAPAAVPSGPYAADPLAQAAYDKAKAAKADAATNPKAGDAAAIAAGKTQFETKCVTCHGATGMGDGIAGSALPQKPANFHDKSRWDYSTVGTKHWIVMNGIQGTAMAPLGLTDDQAWEVLAYIQSEFGGK
jgi:high-affinity iron transporter